MGWPEEWPKDLGRHVAMLLPDGARIWTTCVLAGNYMHVYSLNKYIYIYIMSDTWMNIFQCFTQTWGNAMPHPAAPCQHGPVRPQDWLRSCFVEWQMPTPRSSCPTVAQNFSRTFEEISTYNMVKLLIYIYIYIYLVGGFNLSEKYESQLGLLFPIYGKIKHVPNHRPYIYICICIYIFTFLYLEYYYIKILIHIVIYNTFRTYYNV